MVLNLLDGGHLSYVCNVSAYLCKYQCELCQSNFDRLQNLKRHMKSCSKQTKHKFPCGYYTLPMTIFDKLERVDVVVPHSERFYDFLATFDCESALRPVRKLSDDDDDAEKTTYLNTHIPVSISVASNVQDFTDAKFFLWWGSVNFGEGFCQSFTWNQRCCVCKILWKMAFCYRSLTWKNRWMWKSDWEETFTITSKWI